jgi:hypothetical protein
MRTLTIALVAATLTIPSVGYSQDQGLVSGKVGSDLQSPLTAQPGSPTWAHPYGAPVRATQEHAGYGGTVTSGQVVPETSPVIRQPGGIGSASVNGHRVLVDPNTNRIIRVLN